MSGKHLQKNNPRKNRIILSICSVLLILILLITAAYAWFSMENNHSKYVGIGIGKVKYQIPDGSLLFYNAFELEDDASYDDDSDVEDTYVPATSVSAVLAGGNELIGAENIYALSLPQGDKTRLSLTLDPVGSTDKISYASSNPASVIVSAYGLVRAIGNAGDTAVITVTVHDRDPLGTRADIILQVRVTVSENTAGSINRYGYLPGDKNILRTPLTATNYSTVPSKLRLRIEWKYSDFAMDDGEEAPTPTDRTPVSVETLLTGIDSPRVGNIDLGGINTAPVHLIPGFGFVCVPSDGMFSFSDEAYVTGHPARGFSAASWTIEMLMLTPAEQESFKAALTSDSTFTVESKMINQAYTYLCYSDTAVTVAAADYGSFLPKTENTVAGTAYTVLDGIWTDESYTSFSTCKLISINIKAQARQAEWFTETGWFDVAVV